MSSRATYNKLDHGAEEEEDDDDDSDESDDSDDSNESEDVDEMVADKTGGNSKQKINRKRKGSGNATQKDKKRGRVDPLYRGARMQGKGYQANITINHKHINLGTYATAKEAAIAYDRCVIAHRKKTKHTGGNMVGETYGSRTKLNFLEGEHKTWVIQTTTKRRAKRKN